MTGMTGTTTRRDPLASTGALTTDERQRLPRLTDTLAALRDEQVLALLLLAETPSVTGRRLP